MFSLCCVCFVATSQSYAKYSKIRIKTPAGQAERRTLIDLMDVDHFSAEDGYIVAEVSAYSLELLRSRNYRFEILVDDVTRSFVEESQRFFRDAAAGIPPTDHQRGALETSGQTIHTIIPTPSLFSTNGLPPGAMGGFYTFSEMNAKMDQLASAYPQLVQKTSIGKSIENRDIWMLKISANVNADEDEPEVLYLGLQHAREAITGTSLIFFAQYLVQNYGSIQAVTELLDNRELFLVPCVNPDGYVYNQLQAPNGGGMQRKNRRNVGVDDPGTNRQKGIDLNRNYGVDWADCSGASSSCGSANTSAQTYWGTSAFSEPETQAIRDLCYARNFVAAFDQHCSGPYYSLPFGRRSYHSMNPADANFYTFIPALMGKHNGHRAGDSQATVDYEVAGGAKDWWLLGDIETVPGEPNRKGKIYGMTGEAGGGGFWAPSDQIIELCKNLCFQNMQLAFAAGSYVDVQDQGDISLSSSNLTPGLEFSVQRVGLGNEPVTVRLVPLQNIVSVGAPVVINSMPGYYETYQGSIGIVLSPSLGNGQVVRFIWEVSTGGITIRDTVSKLFNPIELITDNMENGAISAQWISDGNWDYTSNRAKSGARSMTESPSGNYSSGSTRRIAYGQSIDLGDATIAYLSFWVRHRSENFRDKLRIQVSSNSTNGSNGSWTSLVGRNTVQESNTTNGGTLGGVPALTGIRENWTRELIQIPAAFYNSPNVWLRFEFTSNNSSSGDFENHIDDGFYIDDVKLVKSTSALVTLPVRFISFTGRLLADATIRLDWRAETDEMHDYFEVERSSNGASFTSLGRVSEPAPYRMIDPAPRPGSNFYRIKQLDKDGTITYSSIVRVDYLPSILHVSVYPNPVHDILRVRIESSAPDTYSVALTDLAGRVIHRESVALLPGSREISMAIPQQAGQLYIVTVRNSRHELLSIRKVMKE